MARAKRILLTVAVAIVGLAAIVYLAAWLLLPKDWIANQAMRLASRMQGGTVRWDRLSPGLSGLSIGVRLENVSLRLPAEKDGEARVQARAQEVFVRFRLLPLLLRRVEVDAARVANAGLILIEREEGPDEEEAKEAARQSFTFRVPRLEFVNLTVRNRDRFGSGTDLRGLSGHAAIDGALSNPTAIRIEADADSVSWKPSAAGKPMPLPSPLVAKLDLEPREGARRLEITRGEVRMGALESRVSGSLIRPARTRDPYGLDLLIVGPPQSLKSGDPAFRAIASTTPAVWSATASWRLKVTGTSEAMIQSGEAVLQPLAVASGPNRFQLGRVNAAWRTTTDQRFTAQGSGSGSGVSLAFRADGSTAPGGGTRGSLTLRAPATRLNGVIPNTPTWTAGAVEARANFELDPPAPPRVTWTLLGKGLAGTVHGLRRPVTGLTFHIDGDDRTAWIRSMNATVGSSKASLTGSVQRGTPLGTGTFRASLDRFVAEEWTDPSSTEGAKGGGGPPVPPSIPLKGFDAMVTVGEARSGRFLVRNISAPVRFADDNLVASPLHGEMGTGSLAGRLDIRNVTKAPTYTLHAEMSRVPVKEFVSGVLPVNLGLTGFASGEANLAGAGLPGASAMKSLQGALQGKIEDGKILETPTITALRHALGVAVGTEEASDLTFQALSYAAKIEQGRLLIQKMSGGIGKDLMELSGWAGFDRTLDLDILLRLAPGRTESRSLLAKFAKYARDADGRLPVKIEMTGTLSNPKIAIRPATTVEAAGKGLAESTFEKVISRTRPDSARTDRDTTRPAGADSGQNATPKTPARADTTKAPDPLEKAKEAIERILGK